MGATPSRFARARIVSAAAPAVSIRSSAAAATVARSRVWRGARPRRVSLMVGGLTVSLTYLVRYAVRMRAIQIPRTGGPEVLTAVDVPDPVVGPGRLLIDVDAAGINYADTHLADGSYLTRPPLPYVPGSEVIGRTADGRRLMSVTEGGGYASKAVVAAALAVDVPDGVGDGEALALLAQGLTAWHLLRTCARLNPGE